MGLAVLAMAVGNEQGYPLKLWKNGSPSLPKEIGIILQMQTRLANPDPGLTDANRGLLPLQR